LVTKNSITQVLKPKIFSLKLMLSLQKKIVDHNDLLDEKDLRLAY